MMQLFAQPNYDFIGKRKWAYLLSAVVVLAAVISLAVQGLRYDVDFTGGTLVQVRFEQPPSVDRIRAALGQIGLGDAVIQSFGGPDEFIARIPLRQGTTSEKVGETIRNVLAADATLGKFEIRRVEYVGPQVGRELQRQAIYAVLVGLVGILVYIAVRFDLKGGVAAVVAVFHDVMVCLGALSITHREFSLPVLAALLTIIGYSVNDTIVAYDRLRENRGRPAQRGRGFALQMNDAVNQTLSRTVLTALTVLFSTVILLFFGGKVLQDLAFVLTVGTITGTYSTIYIAGALVVDWTLSVEQRLRRSPRSRGSAGGTVPTPARKKAAVKG